MFNLKLGKYRPLAICILTLFVALVFVNCALATPFTIKAGETTKIQQILDGVG